MNEFTVDKEIKNKYDQENNRPKFIGLTYLLVPNHMFIKLSTIQKFC
jgi:hypothetical protein